MKKYLDNVTQAAKTLNLVDHAGRLVQLDSLAVLDLITELEHTTQISIPTSELRPEAFVSFEAVAALLDKLSRAA